MLQGRMHLFLAWSLSGDEELEGLEAEGTAKTNSIFQRPSWLAGLGPSGLIESNSLAGSPGYLSPAQTPPPGAKGNSFCPCPEGSRAPLLPRPPQSLPSLANISKSHSEVSLGKAFPDSPHHSTSSVSLHFCSTRLVGVGGGGGVRLWCVWHVYVVCVVCVWCVSGV